MNLKLSNCIIVFAASAFQAFGMYNIHALADVTEGGVLGMTLLLQHWGNLSPAVSGFFLNVLCYILGWRTLGKEFLGYSAVAATGFSVGYALCECFRLCGPGLPDILCPRQLREHCSSASARASVSGQAAPPAAMMPWL